MDIKKIKSLVELVTSSGISELEISEEGHSLKIVGCNKYNKPTSKEPIQNVIANNHEVVTESINNAEQFNNINTKIIYSPMVGTFYRSSAPNNPAFVEIGQAVTIGAVVCIVEAMKLMNQIESEFSGKITKIFVENGNPVEYGQPLFEIE
jgi:acetyl-CoA carboxylase biotin carboxyl carrier protein